jgi:putative ABC transport system permease protein
MEILALILRNLRSHSVRSLLTLLGILVATAAMVLFMSFGEGLSRALGTELGHLGPSIEVLPQGSSPLGPSYPELSPAVLKQIQTLAPRLGIQHVIPTVLLTRGGFNFNTAFFFEGLPSGVNPATVYPGVEAAQGHLHLHGQAVIGALVAQRNALQLGSLLRLSPQIHLNVVGVLKNSGTLADNLVFVPNRVLQNLMGTNNFSAILISPQPSESSQAIAQALSQAIPGIQAQTTGDLLKFVNKALAISNLFRFGISLVALIVGGLLVANTVMMSVYERIREFGLMRAIGARRSFIFRLVLLESLILGALGGALGLLVGTLGSLGVDWYTQARVGLPLSAVTPRLALFALAIALLLGLIAGFWPARTASRLSVVQALERL